MIEIVRKTLDWRAELRGRFGHIEAWEMSGKVHAAGGKTNANGECDNRSPSCKSRGKCCSVINALDAYDDDRQRAGCDECEMPCGGVSALMR